MLEGAHDGLESNVSCGPEPQTCILLCDAFSTFSMWCWFLLFINIRLTKEKTFLSNTPKKCAKFQTIFYWFKCFSFNVRLISDLQVWVNWYWILSCCWDFASVVLRTSSMNNNCRTSGSVGLDDITHFYWIFESIMGIRKSFFWTIL